ncbi:chemotaxis protein CheD [Ahrensia sp. 13_GOM-1096m]|uniref:chemotaxis protein CheD n=1 Tax=Ahrensia sp. 13_GOM-1096m TaxID=1380380 RepID=UPI00047931A1|nr:chemotaxis protein CheD [Ahrensia sp. 13_GOM-1096m]
MFDNMVKVSVMQRSHHVSSDANTVLSAVLGSCVAVCAFDATMGIGGMNHMLLPDAREKDQNASSTLYGANLMELLLNDLYKQGARRQYLQFKLFGGGKLTSNGFDAGERNINFISEFVKNEGLNVISSSLGGNAGRRIEFHPATGRSRQKLLIDKQVESIALQTEIIPETGTMELF